MTAQTQSLAKLLLVLVAAIWGSTFFVIRDSVDVISPAVLLTYRFLITFTVLGLVALMQKKSLTHNWRHGLVLGVLMTLTLLPQSWGLQFTSAANSGFITGLTIVFVPIYSLLFWQKSITRWQVISILIALTGLYLLVGGLHNINVGDMITLITAASFGFYVVYAQHFMQISDAIVLTCQQALVIASISWIVGLLTQASFAIPWQTVGSSIFYLSLVATCLAFSWQLIGQKYVPALQASLILSTEPLFAAFFAWLLGGETISTKQLLGGSLIFLAIVGNEYFSSKASNKPLVKV